MTYAVGHRRRGDGGVRTTVPARGHRARVRERHALAHLEHLRGTVGADTLVVVNLSGRGDKDLDEYFRRRDGGGVLRRRSNA